ncbi:MAG: type II toxin-antitoxin system VapC family toxin [Pseudomonadota bacterium]
MDASVAVKWLVDEPGSDGALALRNRRLAAPALLRIEVANTIRTLAARGAVEADEARNLFALFQTAPVMIVDADAALEAEALYLALDLGHPVYDCLYLALADRLDCDMITADRRFASALGGHPLGGRAALLDAAA